MRAQGEARYRYGRPARGWWGHPAWWYGAGYVSPLWVGWGWSSYAWAPGPYGTYGGWYDERDAGSSERAMVELDVEPRQAAVHVDGEEIGVAREFNGSTDYLYLEPGRHEIELRAEGYKTLRLHLDARPGRSYHIEHGLVEGHGLDPRSTTRGEVRRRRARDTELRDTMWRDRSRPRVRTVPRVERGRLRVETEPWDAAVYLDGKFLGRGGELGRLHGGLSVPEGRHRLEVVKPGYRDVSRSIEVEAGETTEVEVTLRRDRRGEGDDEEEEEEDDEDDWDEEED